MKGKISLYDNILGSSRQPFKVKFFMAAFFILLDFRGYTDVTTTFGQYFVWVTQILR